MTLLMLSILFCMTRNRGNARVMTRYMATSRMGMATARIRDSRGLMRIAMMTPPMQVTGERTSMRMTIIAMFCTCSTSLVRRVIREAEEKRSMSAKENSWVLLNMARRRL